MAPPPAEACPGGHAVQPCVLLPEPIVVLNVFGAQLFALHCVAPPTVHWPAAHGLHWPLVVLAASGDACPAGHVVSTHCVSAPRDHLPAVQLVHLDSKLP